MNRPDPADGRIRRMRLLWTVVAAGFLVSLLVLAWQRGWLERLADHEQVVAWMHQEGTTGPLLCIGINFVQVVIFAIPGEITQIAAGYVFGPWYGFLYSLVGILLGSAFAFCFAKVVGRPGMRRILGLERLARADRLLDSRKGLLAVFTLFLLPGMPKDALSYGAGLSAMRLSTFLVLSVPARMPALLLSTLFGSEAHDGDYAAMIWIAVVAGILLVLAGSYRRLRSA